MKKEFFYSRYFSCVVANTSESYSPPSIPTRENGVYLDKSTLDSFLSSETLDCSFFTKFRKDYRVYWDESVDRSSLRMPSYLIQDLSSCRGMGEHQLHLLKMGGGKILEKVFLHSKRRTCFPLIFQTSDLIYFCEIPYRYYSHFNMTHPDLEFRAFDAETLEEVPLEEGRGGSKIRDFLSLRVNFFRDSSRSPETFVYIREGKICRTDEEFETVHQEDLCKICPRLPSDASPGSNEVDVSRSSQQQKNSRCGEIMKIDEIGSIYVSFDYWIVILNPSFEVKVKIYLPDFCQIGDASTDKNQVRCSVDKFSGKFMKNGDLLKWNGYLEKRTIYHTNLPGGDLHVLFRLQPEPDCAHVPPKSNSWPSDDKKSVFDTTNSFLIKTFRYHE